MAERRDGEPGPVRKRRVNAANSNNNTNRPGAGQGVQEGHHFTGPAPASIHNQQHHQGYPAPSSLCRYPPPIPVVTRQVPPSYPTPPSVQPPQAPSNALQPQQNHHYHAQAPVRHVHQPAPITNNTIVHPNHHPTPSTSTQSALPKRSAATPLHLEQLQKTLDMSKFVEQLERLIEQPIKIPGTLSMGPPGHHSSAAHRQGSADRRPGKAKRDLLSVDDIWENEEEHRRDVATLYNTGNVGEDRQWLMDMLLEESDADSGGEEHFTEEDLKELLKVGGFGEGVVEGF